MALRAQGVNESGPYVIVEHQTLDAIMIHYTSITHLAILSLHILTTHIGTMSLRLLHRMGNSSRSIILAPCRPIVMRTRMFATEIYNSSVAPDSPYRSRGVSSATCIYVWDYLPCTRPLQYSGTAVVTFICHECVSNRFNWCLVFMYHVHTQFKRRPVTFSRQSHFPRYI